MLSANRTSTRASDGQRMSATSVPKVGLRTPSRNTGAPRTV